ncbi:hypothetical protein [Ulvibacter litoralis]|uniref:Transglutaminase-like superfamily protein n=1 Tax=Ulvibacter litoralis TaxID=227084 RepID=A0A1G7JKI6_9FLAO|nr:hypothetical protein [Ulvibacter litoralis]GHC65411.1 hypothetical protein GCM10008083_33290 [Ulvibacter litoralis]SDF25450.1 hypothetical protein SAMN05421855_1171 [Ulvibacter litoralis]
MNIDYILSSKDKLTELVKKNGIKTWNELTDFIKNLPYGRNKNRIDFELVISEKKGTCSSKHAILKRIADLNNIPNINLIVGIYRMNQYNTPKIGNELKDHSIEFIPEAHCYLKINGKRIDLTTRTSEFKKIEKDIIQEKEIKPEQVAEYKIEYHKDYIKHWLINEKMKFSFDQIWKIREKCIENLTD